MDTPRVQMVRLFAVVAVVLSFAAPVVAELTGPQQQQLLEEAQEAYDQGIALLPTKPGVAREYFRESATRFQQLIDDGLVNGSLHYNLANANLQSGDLGLAILNYRQAERFISGDPRLEENLQYARTLCANKIQPSGKRALTDALLSMHRRTALRDRFIGFAVGYCVFWVALLAGRFFGSPLWRILALLAALVWLALGASIAADLWWPDRHVVGVILDDQVTVRKGNGAGFAPQFEQLLHQGVEFELIERRGDWFHIELPDGKMGWIEHDQAGLVG